MSGFSRTVRHLRGLHPLRPLHHARRRRIDLAGDPVTYTAPFTMRLTITSQPGYEMYEYSCHEGTAP